ncbi:MAG: hypothetical protein JRI25_23280, partial [Deltaproteobacteria bacterium]|nr:hypothetical protein [Deltaproteobacteria bacterium]
MKHLILLFVPLVLSACKGEPEDTEVRPPSAPVVSLDPDPATSADDISVVIDEESVDPAGRSVTYLYEWSSDASGTYEGATLPAAQTAKGETWTATATPNNGAVDGPSGDANTTILNSLPSIASVSISPDPAYANSDLTCTANGVVDADGESVTLAYAWTVEGTAAGSASTLASTEFGRYEDIVCTVTPSDSDGTGTAVTSPTLTISNRPPSITGASVTPTTAYTDTTLTCTPSGWLDEDGDSEGYSYAWTAGGSAVGGDTAGVHGHTHGWLQRRDAGPEHGGHHPQHRPLDLLGGAIAEHRLHQHRRRMPTRRLQRRRPGFRRLPLRVDQAGGRDWRLRRGGH